VSLREKRYKSRIDQLDNSLMISTATTGLNSVDYLSNMGSYKMYYFAFTHHHGRLGVLREVGPHELTVGKPYPNSARLAGVPYLTKLPLILSSYFRNTI
jgi:hypothetical protein